MKGSSVMLVLLGCLFVLGVAVHSADALYSPKDGVILATDATFNALVLQSNRPSIVEFFAPWCGHCKNLAPEYKKAAAATKGMVNIVAIDCDDASNRPLCSRYDVKGFPTLKLFTPGQKAPTDYQGPRTAKPIVDAVLAKLDAKNIKKLTAKSAEGFLADKELPKVLLFTSKPKSSHLYMALSMEFKGKLAFAEILDKETSLAEKYGVESFPTLLVVKNDEEQTVTKYEGELGYRQLDSFLATFAPKSAKASKGAKSEKAEAKAEPTPVPLEQKLYALESDADYTKYCVEQRRICAIGFVPSKEQDEEEHDKAVKALEALAAEREAGDAFLVMWVDGAKATGFRRTLDLAFDLPTFAVASPKKKGYAPFRGAFTPKAMGEFLDSIKHGVKRTHPLPDFPASLFDTQA